MQKFNVYVVKWLYSEKEAGVMRANSWLYHYYSVQSKLQYGLGGGQQASSPYEAQSAPQPSATAPSPAGSRQQYYQQPESYHQHYQQISYR